MDAASREELSLDFRARDASRITEMVVGGISCGVIGIGSIGKTNLMRFLCRQDVWEKYADTEKVLPVYIDSNKLARTNAWGLLELMLHQLALAAASSPELQRYTDQIRSLHESVLASRSSLLALRSLDSALQLCMSDTSCLVTFLFDEFDGLCRDMRPRGFRWLRALRDEHKPRMTYVVATRWELARLRDPGEIEAFEELVSPNTIWLGPYALGDGQDMLRRLSTQRGSPLDDATSHQLMELAGNHPGLLRALYYAYASAHPAPLGALASARQVTDECRRIWFSLTEAEREALREVVAEADVASSRYLDEIRSLRNKGVLVGTRLFSPLFAERVIDRRSEIRVHLYLDEAQRRLWVEGRPIPLSCRRYRLVDALFQKRGVTCTKEELLERVYAEKEISAETDDRIGYLVKKLRKAIEVVPSEPVYLLTVPQHGYRLASEDELNATSAREAEE